MRLFAGAVVLVIAGIAAQPAAATPPGRNGEIVWQREVRDRPPALWATNVDGTAQRRIFPARSASGTEGAWSPTAPTTLAFTRATRTRPPAIYAGDLATGRTRRLTRAGDASDAPAFSPDGARIAFFTDRDFPPARDEDDPVPLTEIYVMDADGSDRRRLTRDRVYSVDPDFSPDGRRIVFEELRFVGRREQNRIAVIDVDGRNRRALTRFGAPNAVNPKWMPDGQRVVFELRRRGTTGSDIVTIAAEGGDLRNVLATRARETDPAPSPDGTRIAFTSDRDRPGGPRRGPGFELYTMAVDGTGIVRLTNNRSPDLFPDWQRLP
jgi:Tol biopolymer transport system component